VIHRDIEIQEILAVPVRNGQLIHSERIVLDRQVIVVVTDTTADDELMAES